MMNRALRVGVVGCGEIAQIAHLPYLNELPEFEIGAICDISATVLKGVGDRFGVEHRYQDYHQLVLQKDLDAVVVCNKDHMGPSIAAMQVGLHVLVEKPMAFNLEQADRMIATARENKVKLMVGYMKRYDPAFQYALSQINELADVHLVRVHDYGGAYFINGLIYDLVRADDVDPAFIKSAQKQEKADMIQAIGQNRTDCLDAFEQLLYSGAHDANLLHETFGLPDRIQFSDVHDTFFVTAILEYGNGMRCVWELGRELDLIEWDEEFAVFGSGRRISVRFPFPYLKNAPTRVLVNQVEDNASVNKEVVVSFDEAFKREWRHFYECVTEDKEPITNAEKARADLAFLIDLVKVARP